MKTLFLFLTALPLLLTGYVFSGQNNSSNQPMNNSKPPQPSDFSSPKEFQTALPSPGEEIVELQTTAGTIKIRLFPTEAPTLSENFLTLAREGKYSNTPFHRSVFGFMIQSGDYTKGDGTGGESYFGRGLADEYSDNLRHYRGAVAAAKSSLPNSIGSQFYIVHQDSFFLDQNYSIFGQVIEGMDVVDKIASAPVLGPDNQPLPGEEAAELSRQIGRELSTPAEPIIIEKAIVSTFSPS